MAELATTMLLVLACLSLAAFLRLAGVVYAGRTKGGWTVVHNDTYLTGQRVRVLDVAGTYQSATYLDERWAQPVFRYHNLFEHLFDDWPEGSTPQTVAVLGGGGYAIPKHLVAHHPELRRIDVVEIDSAIERIARKHFFLDRLEQTYHAERDGILQLHVDDARHWLAECNARFDAIINDCFLALQADEDFMGPQGARLVHHHLTPAGIYLTNVVSALEGDDSQTLYRVTNALAQVFAHVWVYPCNTLEPESMDNNIVIAADAPRTLRGAWAWPGAEA